MSVEIGTATLLAEPVRGSEKKAAAKDPLALITVGFANAMDAAQTGVAPQAEVAKIDPEPAVDADSGTGDATQAPAQVDTPNDLVLMLTQMNAAASATQARPARLTSTAERTTAGSAAVLAVTDKAAPADALTCATPSTSTASLPLNQSAEGAPVINAVLEDAVTDTTVAVTDGSATLTRSDTAQPPAVSPAASSEAQAEIGTELHRQSSVKVASAAEVAPTSTQTSLAPHAESPVAKPDAKVAAGEPSPIVPAEVVVNGQRPETQTTLPLPGKDSSPPVLTDSSRVANASQRLPASPATPPSAMLPLPTQWASAIGDVTPHPAQRQHGKSSLPADYGVAGLWAPSALASSTDLSARSLGLGASVPDLSQGVADTVAFWAAQGVQNADLKLDGFGEHTVQVHIALKGDQAQIGFRTDQPEIRAILEGANAPLKELLRSEGLTLAGVSVGSSGQHSAAQDQGAAGGQRQRSLIGSLPTVSVHSVRGIKPTSAGVDIFV